LHAAIDYCPFKPWALYEARARGLIRTHAQVGEMILGDDGDTFYLGSKMSDVRLCCYDKRGFTRSELRFRNGHARLFLAELMARSAEQLAELALGALRAFVDFVDSREDSNISRCSLLPFWSDFIGRFEAVRVAPKKAAASLGAFLLHVRKQAATFRTYVACMVAQGNTPEHVAREFLAHGEVKMGTRHRSLIVAAEHARAWCPS
jgi:DNA relaxase NicK